MVDMVRMGPDAIGWHGMASSEHSIERGGVFLYPPPFSFANDGRTGYRGSWASFRPVKELHLDLGGACMRENWIHGRLFPGWEGRDGIMVLLQADFYAAPTVVRFGPVWLSYGTRL